MLAMIAKMKKDIEKEILTAYEAKIAMDASEGQFFNALFKALRVKWDKRFDSPSKEMAKWFAESNEKRSRLAISRKLKEVGFTVQVQMTPSLEKKVTSMISSNTSLIKSIPEKYLDRVEIATKKALRVGRDLATLKQSILKIGASTDRRAALIARDQMNKASKDFSREQAKSVGSNKGRWIHIPGVHSSRESHEAMDGHVFDLDVGLYDPDVGAEVLPGELPNCECDFEILLPGFD